MASDVSTEVLAPSAIVADRPAARFRLWPALDRILQPTLAIAVFLSAWELAPRLGWVNPTFLPPFSQVIVSGVDYTLAGKLGPQVLVSLERAAGGFFLGVVTAVPLGLILGWFNKFERYLNPLLQLLRQTNPVSLFPVFILFFGIGYMTKVAIIYWVVVWPILLSTMAGVQYVDPALIRYGRTLGLSHTKLFTKIVLPSSVPSIITGMRLAATYSYLMLVVSEMVGASSGLGYMIVNAQYLMSINLLYVGVIVLALLGIGTNYALVALERRLTSWKGEAVR
jgi:NitT/TauT family transport system permease protein